MRRTVAMWMVLALALVGGPAALATESADEGSDNMSLVANWDADGAYRQGSDLAFWQDMAVLGKYDGLTLMDISNPTRPQLLGELNCNGSQNDVSIWKDLVFISVDSPMAHDGCDAGGGTAQAAVGMAWEGIRIIDVSDPTEPEQIATVYTDCGSHTHTLVPDLEYRDPYTGKAEPRVVLYSSSYPLGGQGTPCNAATHRKISVVEVPLDDPTSARVVSMPDVTTTIGCHDITVFLPRKLAGAACISESQIWDISDPTRPVVLSRIRNPSMQIHHSSAFSWDGEVLVLGDEKGGAAAAGGCHASGEAPTGALWFYDISDPVRPQVEGWFVAPQNEPGSTMCTAHNFNVVPLKDSDRRILVTSWYHGGTHVVDFTDPANPEQIGWYKAKDEVRGTPWSSYWYNDYIYANNFDAGYVPPVPESRGFDVLTIDHPDVGNTWTLTHLNPQTQEALPGLPPRAQRGPVSAEVRAAAAAQPPPAAAPASSPSTNLPFCLLN